jgi:hypothetical protein
MRVLQDVLQRTLLGKDSVPSRPQRGDTASRGPGYLEGAPFGGRVRVWPGVSAEGGPVGFA